MLLTLKLCVTNIVYIFRAKSSCPAYIILVADRYSNRLKVKSAKLDHNHQLSLALKQSYPESQRLDDSAKKTALELLSMGIKADDLSLQMSEKKGKLRTRKDVHNLRTTHRLSNDSYTSIELPTVMEGIPRTSLPVTVSSDCANLYFNILILSILPFIFMTSLPSSTQQLVHVELHPCIAVWTHFRHPYQVLLNCSSTSSVSISVLTFQSHKLITLVLIEANTGYQVL